MAGTNMSNASKRSRSKRIGTDEISGQGATTAYSRPHRCSFNGCNKSFTRSEHLRRHQLNHQSGKSWTCPECSASFVRRDLWQRHVVVSHKTTEKHETVQGSGISDLPPSQEDGETDDADEHMDVQTDEIVQLPWQLEDLEGPEAPGPELSFEIPQLRDLEDLMMNYPFDKSNNFTSHDLEWFLQDPPDLQEFELPDLDATVFGRASQEPEYRGLVEYQYTLVQVVERAKARGGAAPPIFLQDRPSKLWVARTGDLGPPSCGFRVCNAMTEDLRVELLAQLLDIVEVDTSDPIFSLNSMKQGVHLYFRNINIEYSFLHHDVLFPSRPETGQIREHLFGAESLPGPLLFWAIITIGWDHMKSENNYEHKMAIKIQRGLRSSLLNHPGLTGSPPLWLVQAMYMVLMFARYQGDREEYGFASLFHGVLLEATKRLDTRQTYAMDHQQEEDDVITAWVKWIHKESIQRMIRQTFISDVKNCILHGGELKMDPFDLSLRLTWSEDTWYAGSAEEWASLNTTTDSVSFLEILKVLWNPRATKSFPVDKLPRASNIMLYGILSIAKELCRRKEIAFLDRKDDSNSLVSLGNIVGHSLDNWELLWSKVAVPPGLVSSFLWRDCSCMIRLAHTVYEVGPVDLQTVAGKEVIEGKRIGPSDYTRSRRKLGRWARQHRARIAVSRAASMIQQRLLGSSSVVHCHHCLWCLYLAALICWNFGFALTGKSSADDLVHTGRLLAAEDAERECEVYLDLAVSLPSRRIPEDQCHEALGRTSGMLIVLIRFLRDRCQTGIITESTELLARLVGMSSEAKLLSTQLPA